MSRSTGPIRRRLAVNAVASWAAALWTVAIGALALPVLLNAMGASRFGVWALVQTLSATNGWASVLTLGLATATTRRVAHATNNGAPDDANVMPVFAGLGAAIGVSFSVTAAWWLPALVGASGVLRVELERAAPWIGLQLALDTLLVGVGACLEGRLRVDLSRLVDAVRRTALFGGAMGAAVTHASLQGVLAASAIATAAAALIGVIALGATSRQRLRWRVTEVRALVRAALAATTPSITGVIGRSMDRLLVGYAFGPAAVVPIEIASRFRDVAILVLGTSSYTALSASAWLKARGDERRLRELLVTGTKLSVLAGWGTIGLALVLHDQLLALWMGEQFAFAGTYVIVVLVYLAIQTPAQFAMTMVVGMGSLRRFTVTSWAVVIVNLAVSVLMLRAFGPIGVFYGSLLTTGIEIPLFWWTLQGALPISLGALWRAGVAPALVPAVAGAVAAAIVTFVSAGPLVTVACATALAIAVAGPLALRITFPLSERRALLGRAAPLAPPT